MKRVLIKVIEYQSAFAVLDPQRRAEERSVIRVTGMRVG